MATRRDDEGTRGNAGEEPWFSSGELMRIAALEREVGEQRRALAAVETASAFLVAEPGHRVTPGPRP